MVLVSLVVVRVYGLSWPDEGQGVVVQGLILKNPKTGIDGKVYAKMGQYMLSFKRGVLDKEITYGDVLMVSGKYSRGFIEVETYKIVEKQNLTLLKIRQKFVANIQKALHEPHASLVGGIFLGEEVTVAEIKERLVASGTSHAVVASGGNIAMVTFLVSKLLSGRVHKKYLVLLILFSSLFYTALLGFTPPLFRAFVMSTLVAIMILFGRLSSTLWVLFLTFCLLVIFFPWFIYDVSFLLSTLSVLGIVTISPIIEKFLAFLPSYIKSPISVSVSAQLATAPIIIGVFKSFSILSPFYNLITVWVIPFIFVVSAISMPLIYVSEKISQLVLLINIPFTTIFWYGINLGV